MKTFIISFITVILSVITLTSLQAQTQNTLFGINFTGSQQAGLMNPPEVGNLQNLEAGYKEMEIFGTVPVVRKENTKFGINLKYNLKEFSYDNALENSSTLRPDHLHQIKVRFALKQKIHGKWSVTAMLQPMISSDLRDGLSSEDMFLQGGGVFSNQINEHLNLGIGLINTYSFGQRDLVPTFSAKYESPNEKFTVDVLFPRATVLYQVSQKLELGAMANVEGGRYNYRDLTTVSGDETEYISYSALHVGPMVSYNLKNNIYLNVRGGISVNKSLEVYDTNNILLGDLSGENSAFADIGISYRLK